MPISIIATYPISRTEPEPIDPYDVRPSLYQQDLYFENFPIPAVPNASTNRSIWDRRASSESWDPS
jgi:hypothetical protein